MSGFWEGNLFSKSSFLSSSQRTNSEGDVRAPLRDDVALLPEQTQQQVLGVAGPAVDPGVLEPAGHVSLTETEAAEDS